MDDEKYGIRWTTAQCVLVLKLIGVAFDLYDGHKKVSVLKLYIHVLVQKIYIYDEHVRSFCAFSTCLCIRSRSVFLVYVHTPL